MRQMTEFRESTDTGPDRPDTPGCPSCGEPTDRQLMTGGTMYICTNPDCSSLLYGVDSLPERPAEEQS